MQPGSEVDDLPVEACGCYFDRPGAFRLQKHQRFRYGVLQVAATVGRFAYAEVSDVGVHLAHLTRTMRAQTEVAA